MRTITFGSLFAGIGGFDLGLERAGMTCRWQCEIDPFCNKVLAKHWPMIRRYGDIKEIGKHNLEPVDLICGGFPCQPFSAAGKRRGKEDDRYLWPEMLRVIAEFQPTWVIGENVPGIIHMELDKVLSDLEAEGYETQTLIVPACAVDAQHRRDRVWIIAKNTKCGRFIHMENEEKESTVRRQWKFSTGSRKRIHKKEDVADTESELVARFNNKDVTNKKQRQPGRIGCCGRECTVWLPEPPVGRVANGVPRRVDRLRSLGNAVVPQVVEVIGRFIMKIEDQI